MEREKTKTKSLPREMNVNGKKLLISFFPYTSYRDRNI